MVVSIRMKEVIKVEVNAPFKGKGKKKIQDDQGVLPCAKYGKSHKGECLFGTNTCYRCGKEGHKLRDCRVKGENLPNRGAPREQAAPNANVGQAQRNNRFCALHGKQRVEENPDVVNGML